MYKHTASKLTNMNSDVEFQIARIFGKQVYIFPLACVRECEGPFINQTKPFDLTLA